MNVNDRKPMTGWGGGERATETMPLAARRERTWLQRLSVRSKLISMICFSIVSLASLGVLFVSAINEVKVSGPIYTAIAREMDLRSDILPPPEFLVETHLTVLQMAKALRSDPQQIDPLIKKIEGLKNDFDDRQSHW